MLKITRNSDTPITTNFKLKEFYSKSIDAPKEHELDPVLPLAVQIVRDYYETPIRITSSFRTATHQAFLQATSTGAKLSQHQLSRAVDFQFIKNNSNLMLEIGNQFRHKGELWHKLRKAGITGLGIYATFVHLDTRVDQFTQGFKDEIGQYQFWDRQLLKKKARRITLN